jgi:hypothetical protein
MPKPHTIDIVVSLLKNRGTHLLLAAGIIGQEACSSAFGV